MAGQPGMERNGAQHHADLDKQEDNTQHLSARLRVTAHEYGYICLKQSQDTESTSCISASRPGTARSSSSVKVPSVTSNGHDGQSKCTTSGGSPWALPRTSPVAARSSSLCYVHLSTKTSPRLASFLLLAKARLPGYSLTEKKYNNPSIIAVPRHMVKTAFARQNFTS